MYAAAKSLFLSYGHNKGLLFISVGYCLTIIVITYTKLKYILITYLCKVVHGVSLELTSCSSDGLAGLVTGFERTNERKTDDCKTRHENELTTKKKRKPMDFSSAELV